MDTFSEYVDLLSTASANQYPDNTNSSFTNVLPYTMEFPPGTTVALTECSFNNAFNNVHADRTKISIWDKTIIVPPHSKFNPTPNTYYGGFILTELETGLYKNIEDICTMLNSTLARAHPRILRGNRVFTFDRKTMKVRVHLAGADTSLWIKGPLLNLLGCEVKQATEHEYTIIGQEKKGDFYEIPDPENPKKTIKRYYLAPQKTWEAYLPEDGFFKHPAQLTTFKSLAIYTSLIESQVTGSEFTDALRFVPIKGLTDDNKVGELIVWEPVIPHYLRVKQRYVNAISIRILDLQGYPIEFLMGCVRLKLHFKKSNE